MSSNTSRAPTPQLQERAQNQGQPEQLTNAVSEPSAPRFHGHQATEWELHRERIEELYLNQNLTLTEVQRHMQRAYEFQASSRQYKSHLAKWGLSKNVRGHEMMAILSKHKIRGEEDLPQKLKGSRFMVKGRSVPSSKVERYLKRKNGLESSGEHPGHLSPRSLQDIAPAKHQHSLGEYQAASPLATGIDLEDDQTSMADDVSSVLQEQQSVNENEDTYSRKRKRSHARTIPDESSTRLFACPFYKGDPHIWRVGTRYRTCVGPGFRSVSRMKEHLYRTHSSDAMCVRCQEIFVSHDALREHLRSSDTCEVKPEPPVKCCMSEAQERLLKSKDRGYLALTEEERWLSIFGVLFPGAPLPSSPYYEDNRQQTQSLALEDYLMSYLPSLVTVEVESKVRNLAEENLRSGLQDIVQRSVGELGLKLGIEEIVRDCMEGLLANWRRSSGRLRGESVKADEKDNLRSAQTAYSCSPNAIYTPSKDVSHAIDSVSWGNVDARLLETRFEKIDVRCPPGCYSSSYDLAEFGDSDLPPFMDFEIELAGTDVWPEWSADQNI